MTWVPISVKPWLYPYPRICLSPFSLIQISAAVAFLLSPAAAYITGETIKVDGASSLYMLPGGYTVEGQLVIQTAGKD